MSSALVTSSKKFSWSKKMDAKIKKSSSGTEQDQPSHTKKSSKKEAETAPKSE